MGASARLADLPMVLGRGARHRRIPNPGAADLGEVCVADPETGDVTSSSEARVPHDPKDLEARDKSRVTDLRIAAETVRLRGAIGGPKLADRLEAWADDLEHASGLTVEQREDLAYEAGLTSLGKAHWMWTEDLGCHVPCCSQRNDHEACNGPLVGGQIESGDCGTDHDHSQRLAPLCNKLEDGTPLRECSRHKGHPGECRLEAWADDLERLAPLEAAVLDALNEADIRTGAESTYWRAHHHAHNGDDTRAAELIAAADALSAAADALHTLEAQQ
jgi:hypothetical protein